MGERGDCDQRAARVTKPDRVLWHQSGVNPKGEPFVQLLLGDEIIAQLDPEQAREHAQAILEATEAAEQDAFLMTWSQEAFGIGLKEAAAIMVAYRTWRRERSEKRGGPTLARDWVMPSKEGDTEPT